MVIDIKSNFDNHNNGNKTYDNDHCYEMVFWW